MPYLVESWRGAAAPEQTHHATLRAAWRAFHRAMRLGADCVYLIQGDSLWAYHDSP